MPQLSLDAVIDAARGGHTATMASESRHVSVFISRDPAEVYDYAADPTNLPDWAAGLTGSIEPAGDHWNAESPMGLVQVEFSPPNSFGVLDHWVTAGENRTYNPLRVVADSGGCEVIFTLRREPGRDPEDFERDGAAVAADLDRLKAILETG